MTPDMVIGSTEIVGYEYDNAALVMGAEQITQGQTLGIQNSGPSKGRKWWLGFASTSTVAASGGTASVSAQPQCLFKGKRLIVPSDIAGSFDISDIKIGQQSQLGSSGNIPARVFDERAVGVELDLDTAAVSQLISINVVNNSGAATTFKAAMLGWAVS
jgi:hypothetical protein